MIGVILTVGEPWLPIHLLFTLFWVGLIVFLLGCCSWVTLKYSAAQSTAIVINMDLVLNEAPISHDASMCPPGDGRTHTCAVWPRILARTTCRRWNRTCSKMLSTGERTWAEIALVILLPPKTQIMGCVFRGFNDHSSQPQCFGFLGELARSH